jgi:hypothetical protein
MRRGISTSRGSRHGRHPTSGSPDVLVGAFGSGVALFAEPVEDRAARARFGASSLTAPSDSGVR